LDLSLPWATYIYSAYEICFAGLVGAMNRITSLRVTRETRDRLAEIGGKDDSFDEIIGRLLDFYKRNNKSLKRS